MVTQNGHPETRRVAGISRNYERVVWVDADIVINPQSPPICDGVPIELIGAVDARFVILSFNDDGYISPPEMRDVLNQVGTVTEQRQPYATFRGCRNFAGGSTPGRSTQVTEHVYLIEKD